VETLSVRPSPKPRTLNGSAIIKELCKPSVTWVALLLLFTNVLDPLFGPAHGDLGRKSTERVFHPCLSQRQLLLSSWHSLWALSFLMCCTKFASPSILQRGPSQNQRSKSPSDPEMNLNRDWL
jgi:hypothetical protein